MKRFAFLIQKEFIQVFRNRFMLPIIFVMPFIQLILLSFAANFEVKNLRLATVDRSQSIESRDLTSHFAASANFELKAQYASMSKARKALSKGSVDLILNIPEDFSEDFFEPSQSPQLHLFVDAINGSKAGVAQGYSQEIINSFNQEVLAGIGQGAKIQTRPAVTVKSSDWFNPHKDYKAFMVPGILALLVTLITLFLTSMSIVREKEIGTIEQLNVTPIRKTEFISGKIVPFWIIGLAEMAVGLALGKLIFDIPLEGSLWLVLLGSVVYLWLILSLGIFVSTFTQTQQQAVFLAWFFMVIFLLMSGLFTPIESMPPWAKTLTWFNPVAYMVEFMRMVLLKGSGFFDVLQKLLILWGFGLIMNTLAIWNYRKSSG